MIRINDERININNLKEGLQFLKIDVFDYDFIINNSINGYVVKKNNNKYEIEYNKPCELFKALSAIKINGNDSEILGKRIYDHLGYMVDVARNAVPKIDTLKRLILYLAILGYDRIYLYLEDLFEVESEPFFGYFRGRYSKKELKELDDYSYGFGMELIPCIQTLAHLNTIFKWPEYESIRDINDILLVGNERSNRLIENIFKTISNTFRTKTIHIGMDEAHFIGRGKYLDINGYKDNYLIMREQTEFVRNIAKKYGYELMMWSDMYFRMSFNGGYYSSDKTLKEEVKSIIPKDITQVYWDYYSTDKKTITNMVKEHIKIGCKVAFAGGAWKWTGINPSTKLSLITSELMLKTCEKYGIKNIMLTAWSDDGAEASLFSTIPVVVYYSNAAYSIYSHNTTDNTLKKLFSISLNDFLSADIPLINKKEFEKNYYLGKLPKILLYSDPLSNFYDGILSKYSIENEILRYEKTLKRIKNKVPEDFKYIFNTIYHLLSVLRIKGTLGIRLRKAYKENDKNTMFSITSKELPKLLKNLRLFKESLYYQWMSENKDNGFQSIDLRIGGLIERIKTINIILNEYINGKRSTINELEENIILIEDDDALNMLLWKDWAYINSTNII